MLDEVDTEPAIKPTPSADAGLAALVMLLRLNGHQADHTQIQHRFAGRPIGVIEMLRCGKEFGLKARALRSNWQRLGKMPGPCIAVLQDGGFVLLGRVGPDKAIVQFPLSTKPELMARAGFEALWDKHIVVFSRRAGLTDLSRRFDLSWFAGAIGKYHRLLGEVLLASFFLQIFALVTPLGFQVVIDKVLAQHGMSTLNVVVVALAGVAAFELILSVLRTYLFAHTTNRIDVELGARLFRHLMALPLAYFQTRRTGDSVARVRELENIRNFLTGSTLTAVVDIFFTAVLSGGDVPLTRVD